MLTKQTTIYSILHMFVDGLCALAIFGRFLDGLPGIPVLLLYNFCAFVLQMPIGIVLDGMILRFTTDSAEGRRKGQAEQIPFLFAVVGIVITIAGAFFSPVLLGIGNAFFHVGGGVGTIREDFAHEKKGVELGIFVAPGALGLFVGSQLGKQFVGTVLLVLLVVVSVIMLLLAGVLYLQIRNANTAREVASYHGSRRDWTFSKRDLRMILCCFLVVVFRSYVGLGVSMPWKTTALLSTIAVLAVVFGKMSGGILAARYGIKPVVTVSLLLAAVGYLFSGWMIPGVLALLLFNMTMPITLYLLVERYRMLPGFFFGLLTVALFVGYLPIYFGCKVSVAAPVAGAVGSLLSVLLLLIAVRGRKEGKK